MEKKAMLEVLKEALDSLMPEERELAEKVFGEEMSVCEFARQRGKTGGRWHFIKTRCWINYGISLYNMDLISNGKRFDRICHKCRILF